MPRWLVRQPVSDTTDETAMDEARTKAEDVLTEYEAGDKTVVVASEIVCLDEEHFITSVYEYDDGCGE